MKKNNNMFKYLILFCVFCNFFCGYITKEMGLGWPWLYSYATSNNIAEAFLELLVIWLVMFALSYLKIFSVKNVYNEPHGEENENLVKVCKVVFLLIVCYAFFNINFSFTNATRGENQFDLSHRQGAVAAMVTSFYVPFVFYCIHKKIFKKNIYYIFALFIWSLNGISRGGRQYITIVVLFSLVYFSYIISVRKKYLYLILLAFLIGMFFSATDRYNKGSFAENNFVKIIRLNSDSSFLPVIKTAEENGHYVSPYLFSYHFLGVFCPSFVWVKYFHLLSYPRTTFIFDYLYNPNPNSGLGFMMLADFYWTLGYWGYVLYIILFSFILFFFKRNIHNNDVKYMIMAIFMVVRFCNQRIDFGGFLKPVVYTFLFFCLIEFIAKIKIRI